MRETEYSKTILPELLETQISEALPSFRQILSNDHFREEMDLFSDENFRALLIRNFTRLISGFKETLEKLVKIGPQPGSGRPSELNFGEEGERKPSVAPGVPVKDRKLLIALTNCDYVLRFSLESLVRKLEQNGVKQTGRILEVPTYAVCAVLPIMVFV